MVHLRRYAALGWADVRGFTVLGWLYLLSYFKLFVTSTKYVPQVLAPPPIRSAWC